MSFREYASMLTHKYCLDSLEFLAQLLGCERGTGGGGLVVIYHGPAVRNINHRKHGLAKGGSNESWTY